MKLRSHLVAICLAVVSAVTGQSMAAARGAAGSTGKMVLCVGTTSVVVYMDEQGQPTQVPHFYPDCTLNLLDAVPKDMGSVPSKTITTPYLSMAHIAAHSYLSRAPPVMN